MDYGDLLEKLKRYKRIIIGGIQRSGTTYCASIIAKDLNYQHVDERKYATHNKEKFLRFLQMEGVVIQNVCHTHIWDLINTKHTIAVWIERDNHDIEKSEDKIGWHPTDFKKEKNKYIERFGEDVKQWSRNAPMKKHYWNNMQKHNMSIDYIEVPYCILKGSSGYIEKEKRLNFRAKQIS